MDMHYNGYSRFSLNYTQDYIHRNYIVVQEYVNTDLVAFLYQCLNEHIKLTLLTHHDKNIHDSLKAIRLDNLFDRIIHIDRSHQKSDYIDNEKSIFIDDSFAERVAVARINKIPVFSVDMINMLKK